MIEVRITDEIETCIGKGWKEWKDQKVSRTKRKAQKNYNLRGSKQQNSESMKILK
jgi:hypothetical protein